MKRVILLSAILFTAIFSYAGWVYILEEPKFNVIKEYEEFEIRKYESYVVAEVVVEGNMKDAGNTAFQYLFDYISGSNVKNMEMEMTVPVNQSNAGEKIEMTAPVMQYPQMNSAGKFAVQFVLPLRFTLENAPAPVNERVKLREVPAAHYAVRRYSGSWSEDNYRENEAILLEEVKNAGYKIVGEPVYARYDPPFMPWFMRRNEVMIQIQM